MAKFWKINCRNGISTLENLGFQQFPLSSFNVQKRCVLVQTLLEYKLYLLKRDNSMKLACVNFLTIRLSCSNCLKHFLVSVYILRATVALLQAFIQIPAKFVPNRPPFCKLKLERGNCWNPRFSRVLIPFLQFIFQNFAIDSIVAFVFNCNTIKGT